MTSGFIILDKPRDWTTFDLVRDLRKKSGVKKIGHTGTLDPFATGLVILCIGSATRLSSLLLSEDKGYVATIKLGTKTDTGDITGQVIEEKSVKPLNYQLIEQSVEQMLNLESQKPPQYSAVKIDGRPAYKYARKGETVDLAERKIKVFDFKVSSFNDDSITYQTTVSKGTYIRVLSETFAETLGTVAHTTELRRISVGNIKVNQAVSPTSITSNNWTEHLSPVEEILSDYPKLHLKQPEVTPFLHGQQLQIQTDLTPTDEILIFDSNQPAPRFLGTGSLSENKLQPTRVLI